MIRCDQHDLIEIACLYRIPVRLTLKTAQVITGVPSDTGWTTNHEECLLIDTEQGKTEVVLDTILSMTALQANRHFSEVVFREEK